MKIPAPLLSALEDPKATDICINGSSTFIDRGAGLSILNSGTLDSAELKAWVLDVLARAGRSWDARAPFADAAWTHEGRRFRVHVVFPPISDTKMLISIRRLANPQLPGSTTSRWTESSLSFDCLAGAFKKGESILIAGGTGSGKTTLAADLLSQVSSSERIIALEDTPELQPSHAHFVSLQARPPNADGFGEVTLRTLLRQALRMRPDRLVLGECRGAEVMDLLQALNTGHSGGIATLHANSPRDALRRVETLALLSGTEGLSIAVIREWIASGIQWVAQVERGDDGSRRIREIAQVCGIESGVLVLRSLNSEAALQQWTDPSHLWHNSKHRPYEKTLARAPSLAAGQRAVSVPVS
ncbi:MAG: CpaF family protein [Oligoflexia bacterium]|jgi:pilus assembly protein CpaF